MTRSEGAPPSVLVTGANRGLGLEFARQYLADGWRVYATCRRPGEADGLAAMGGSPGELSVHALDVGDRDSIARLAEELEGTAIDVLLNNAGVFGPREETDNDWRQNFGHIDYDEMEAVIRVNTLAPLRMAEHFCANVAAGSERKIITISSALGSIAETGGGFYAYRASKAAVNMLMATLARELSPQRIRVAVISPGWVRTDMGGESAPLSPETSVAGMRRVIAGLDDELSGSFLRYDGTVVPW